MSKSNASAESVKAIYNQVRALKLRREGYNFREIAEALNVSLGSAYNYVTKALDELKQVRTETAESIRDIELERLDGMTKGLWKKATSGHVSSIKAMLAIMTRRAKLLGLDMEPPAQTEEIPEHIDVADPYEDYEEESDDSTQS